MPVGMEVGLGSGHIVLDDDAAPLKGAKAFKAKFHYAIQVADLVADLIFDLSQTGSS